VLIMISQMKSLFGYTTMPPAHGAIQKFVVALQNWRNINVPNFTLCLFMLLVLDLCKRIKGYAKKKSGSLAWVVIGKVTEMKEVIVIAIGICFAYCTMQEDGTALLPIVGDIPTGLPAFKSPFSGDAVKKLLAGPVNDIQGFVLSGAMIAFTSFLTTYASNQKIALAQGYDLDASQELFALGAASSMGSFFGAFLVCGSLSRTALAAQLGCKTQVVSLVIAAVIAVSLLFLAPLLYYLPKASLAAIVLTSAKGLVDFKTPKSIWGSSSRAFHEGLGKDFTVWCVGFVCTILFGALYGIGIAVLVGVGQVVAEATAPRAATLGTVKELGGQMKDVKEFPGAETIPGILAFQFRGPLCFCSAEGFHEELSSRLTKDVKAVVLDFGSVEYVDFSALAVLKDILVKFKVEKIDCLVGAANPSVEFLLGEKLGKGCEKPLLEIFKGMSTLEAIALLQQRLSSPKADRTHSKDMEFLSSVREQEHDLLHQHIENTHVIHE